MITDAIIKWKIEKLYNTIWRMNNAKAKITDLNNSLNNLKKVMGETIKINDAVAFSGTIDGHVTKGQNATWQINNKINPSLYYSINKMKEKIGG